MISEKRRVSRIPVEQAVDIWLSGDEKRMTGLLKNLSAQGAAIALTPTSNPPQSPFFKGGGHEGGMRFHINLGEENDFLLQGSVVRQSGNLFGLLLKTDFMEEQNLRKALSEFVRAARKCA